jgi:hypothetical protein
MILRDDLNYLKRFKDSSSISDQNPMAGLGSPHTVSVI